MKRCALYRYYGQDGDLLYVGISFDPFRRAGQHGFFLHDSVQRVEFEWFDSREEAEQAEAFAIAIEQPIWNEKDEVIHFHKWSLWAFVNKQYPFDANRPNHHEIIENVRRGCLARGWLVAV